MNYSYFIGIDISKRTLDAAVFKENKLLFHVQIDNDKEGLRSLFKRLKSLPDFSMQEAVFCMEHTGIYNQHVLNFLQDQQANVCLESAVHIKYSSGLQRGKNDKVDAIRIGAYAYEKRDKLKLWKPQREVVQQLSHLAGLRNRLIVVKNQLTVPVNEVKPFNKKAAVQMQKLSSASVRALEKDLEKTDKAMQEVIASDPELKRLFAIVTSVDGIGKVTAVQMIITTGEFTTITEPSRFACYAGVVPFAYTSGTALKGKMRVSHKGGASGFNATLHGIFGLSTNQFVYMKQHGAYWTSTDFSDTHAWAQRFMLNTSETYSSQAIKANGHACRCVKD